jgi:hypothetical protein
MTLFLKKEKWGFCFSILEENISACWMVSPGVTNTCRICLLLKTPKPKDMHLTGNIFKRFWHWREITQPLDTKILF